MLNVLERFNCRVCEEKLPAPFLSLGDQPLANNLLAYEEQCVERYPLEVIRCLTCSLVQLRHVVDPSVLFSHYAYVPSVSQTMINHFEDMSEHLMEFCNSYDNPLIVDIGSNEGLLLSQIKSRNISVMGVDPAKNLVEKAEMNGIHTVCSLFNSTAVESIIHKEGTASVITATNVFAHADDIQSFISDVSALLNEDGVFVIEVPDLEEMLRQKTFDLIYHEHLSYFALSPIVRLLEKKNMEVFRVQKVTSHGGSLRIFCQKFSGKLPVENSVSRRLFSESEWLYEEHRYFDFSNEVKALKIAFTDRIMKHKSLGERISGYGLPAKANTLLNYCGITSSQIEFIVDDNPLKQGNWAPGSRIPIVSADHLGDNLTDCIVVFPWNILNEIESKLSVYDQNSPEIIVPTIKSMIGV